VPLRNLLFLIAGVVGIYTFLFRLSFAIFEDSAMLPLVFVGIGVTLIATAMTYQRWRGRAQAFAFSA
jgi:uncharacterized membrane protein YhaH (DUF805 family)